MTNSIAFAKPNLSQKYILYPFARRKRNLNLDIFDLDVEMDKTLSFVHLQLNNSGSPILEFNRKIKLKDQLT